MNPTQKIHIQPLTTPRLIQEPSSAWKEALLVSAIALAAIACFVQILVGSFSVSLVYGFLGCAAYLGYEAEQRVVYSHRKEEYYKALHANTESLRLETLSFRSENKLMSHTNQNLTEQVDVLKTRLHGMETLLAKIDSSATLTKELLNSCVDVSNDQKKTEGRIHDLLNRLEKTNQITTQKEIEKHVTQLEKTIGSMEKQIKQFFLHDSKASHLLEIKKEFSLTSKELVSIKSELERVQKELSETSSRLEKTSYDIESKISRLTDQETKLCHLKKLVPLLINIFKKQEVFQKLSFTEQEQFDSLQKNWQAILSLP